MTRKVLFLTMALMVGFTTVSLAQESKSSSRAAKAELTQKDALTSDEEEILDRGPMGSIMRAAR